MQNQVRVDQEKWGSKQILEPKIAFANTKIPLGTKMPCLPETLRKHLWNGNGVGAEAPSAQALQIL